MAGGGSLLPPPSLSSHPTPVEQLDFGYRRFIQLQSHMSVKMQATRVPSGERRACQTVGGAT